MMAVALGPLIAEVKESITLDDISGRVVAIDAYNTIYQFITIIRGPDGTPLMDSHGMMTSHLSGLLYRTINLLEHRITPIFVFDGLPPILKQRTLEARMNRRNEALKAWDKALKEGVLVEARTHAVASARITKEIVQGAKELLGYMGIGCIQAPSEGEAQAARMTRDGLVDASASQDYDLFMFGADTVIRNLTISGKRKLPRKNVFVNVSPERIELKKLLTTLGISQKQLIWLGMLMGTDFNEGIDGVGPKTALKIVKQKGNLNEIISYLKEKYNKEFEIDPREVEEIFYRPETNEMKKSEINAMLKNAKPNKERIMDFMCRKHNFSEERVEKVADTLLSLRSGAGQKGMGDWV